MKNKIRKIDKTKIIAQSLIGILCLGLTFFVHWIFLLGCAITIYLNQRELFDEK